MLTIYHDKLSDCSLISQGDEINLCRQAQSYSTVQSYHGEKQPVRLSHYTLMIASDTMKLRKRFKLLSSLRHQ